MSKFVVKETFENAQGTFSTVVVEEFDVREDAVEFADKANEMFSELFFVYEAEAPAEALVF